MSIGRSIVGGLLVLGALGCSMTVLALPAQAYTAEVEPGDECHIAGQAAMAALEVHLSPAEGAAVSSGGPVTFSGNAGIPVTFAVASSPVLLSSPDIDGGLGSLQPGTSTYAFTSTKATATPGTIYWDASFSNATIAECAGLPPATHTTQVRTLTVVSPQPTEAEVAAKKQQEEEAAAKEREAAAAATGSVSLAGSTITVQRNGEAQVELACTGTATCSGKLTLTAKRTTKGKKRLARTQAIGTAAFSIPPDKTMTVKLKLNGTGRALLSAAHGRLGASLVILESSPAPSQTHTDDVYLVQQKAHGKTKK